MRYLLFFSLALLLHGGIAFLFWVSSSHREATPGGGSGGSITISLAPQPTASSGQKSHRKTHPALSSAQTQDPRRGTASGTGSGRASGPQTGVGSSPTGSDTVLAEIRQKIERAKHFPRLARRLQLEGEAELLFHLKGDGSLQSLRISQSSGATILDEAALATVRRAAPFPYYPEPIQITIRFTL